MNSIATGDSVKLEPITREEQYLAYLAGITDAKPEKPITRKEMFYDSISKGGGGGGASDNELVTDTSKNYGNDLAKIYKMSDELLTVKEVETATFEVDGKPSDIVLSQGETPVGYNMCVNSDFTMIVLLAMDEQTNLYLDASTIITVPRGTYTIALADSVITKMIYMKEPGKPYIDTSQMTDFRYFASYNKLNDYLNYLDTSNGVKFFRMFSDCSNLQTIPPLFTSNGNDFSYMFYMCSELQTIPLLDTSNGVSFDYMFYSCSGLQTIPQLNTSKGTRFGYMFADCFSIKSIPQLDTSEGTYFSNMFYRCSRLETVSLTTAKSDLSTSTFQNCTALKNITIGEGWAVNIYLHYSNELTVESLHGMIENLADLTGQTAKTFQIGATNLAKIDEAHINMLQAKNWNYS